MLRSSLDIGCMQVLGLEAQPAWPHAFGSSHGHSRIIRLGYHEHPDYVPLLRVALAAWQQLAKETGMVSKPLMRALVTLLPQQTHTHAVMHTWSTPNQPNPPPHCPTLDAGSFHTDWVHHSHRPPAWGTKCTPTPYAHIPVFKGPPICTTAWSEA